MIRIRLRRVGGTKQPSYRLVVADKEAPRDGRQGRCGRAPRERRTSTP